MSTESQQFLSLFRPEEVTPLFRAVVQQQFDLERIICDGFYMGTSRAEDLKYFIPEDKLETFQNQFVLFAKATHSGSTMGFFRAPGTSNVEEYPLVVFGDEGGTLVLAEGLRNYLSFVTLNVSPYVSTGYGDVKDHFDLFEGSSGWDNSEFVEWVLSVGISRLESLEEAKTKVIAPAQVNYQAAIDAIFKV